MRRMPKLDPTSDEFRAAGHKLIDWVADYLDGVDRYDVLSRVKPGDIEKQFAAKPSVDGRPYDAILAEVDEKIMPGITHWNHPAFFAYFSITGSQAGILAELLTAALNVNGMIWRTSPSLTELETVTLRWLREALGLPDDLFGIINDTASINSFLALAAARAGRRAEHAHARFRRRADAARLLLRTRALLDRERRARPRPRHRRRGEDPRRRDVRDERRRARSRDRPRPRRRIRSLRHLSHRRHDVVRRHRSRAPHRRDRETRERLAARRCRLRRSGHDLSRVSLAVGRRSKAADSIVVNPHKWLFTPIDCSVLYTRHPDVLRETFSLVPEYLKTTDTAEVNYMDYGLQLGRRFRALKLWFVFEHYGIAKMQSVIRQHVADAARLAAELQKRDDVELIAPQNLSVVVFRKVVRNDGVDRRSRLRTRQHRSPRTDERQRPPLRLPHPPRRPLRHPRRHRQRRHGVGARGAGAGVFVSGATQQSQIHS